MDFDLEFGGMIVTVIGVLTGVVGASAAVASARTEKRVAALHEEEMRRHDVTWSLTPLRKAEWYALKNNSNRDTAHCVHVEHTGVRKLSRGPLDFDEIGPGSSVPLHIVRAAPLTDRETVVVTWHTNPEKKEPPRKAEIAIP